MQTQMRWHCTQQVGLITLCWSVVLIWYCSMVWQFGSINVGWHLVMIRFCSMVWKLGSIKFGWQLVMIWYFQVALSMMALRQMQRADKL